MALALGERVRGGCDGHVSARERSMEWSEVVAVCVDQREALDGCVGRMRRGRAGDRSRDSVSCWTGPPDALALSFPSLYTAATCLPILPISLAPHPLATDYRRLSADSRFAYEAYPFTPGQLTCHEVFLAGWGLPIGELFDLRKLAEVCAEKKKWTFFFSSMPMNMAGGIASPPNAQAIL